MSDFNAITPLYDILANVVFLGRVNISQRTFLTQEIHANDSILILGGGSGYILQALDELRIDLNITYVDKSHKMIEKAKCRKVTHGVKVTFVTGNFMDISLDHEYDILITNFFLDLFDDLQLESVTKKLCLTLRSKGRLLVTDFEFYENRYWQRKIHKIMLWFFKSTANLDVSILPDHQKVLLKYDFIKLKEKRFFQKFIVSRVYKSN